MAAENTLSTARQRRPHLARDVAGFAVPLLTFVALLLITFVITRNLADQASINAQLRFLNDTDRGLAEIKARVRTYEDLLRNTQSLFLANPKLTRQQWQQYVNSLQVQQRYPGLASLGFVAYVPQNQQTAFLESTRADGAPNFAIHSSGTNPDLMVLKYVMALPRNDAVLGWDLGADPAQRTAAEAARDTGQTIISPKLTLPQDTGGQSAFIMLVPVYTSDGSTSAGGQNLAVADPRGNLVGWIYGGIHPDVAFQDLMSGSSSDLSFEVFDGKTTDQASLLWDSDIQRAAKGTTPEKTDRKLLTVGGRDWTVGINSLPAFDALLANTQNPTLLIVGGIASLLAAIALYALMNTQRNAITLADRMTAALRESEERFRLITENAADLIAVVDRNNRRLYNSPSYQTILGYTPDELRRTSALDQVHPDDRDRVNQLAAESLKTGVGRTIEYRMKHKDGGYRVLESIATVIRDDRGQPENFVIVARDVTERKAQEALLRRQNEYLSALQQTTLGLVSHLSLKDLLANLINRATDLVSVKHGNIALTTADGSELETLVGVGVYSKRIGAKVKPGRDLSGQVWQTGQPMTVEDYQKMPGRIASADLDTLHAMAAFPLKTGNRVVGVISVARERVGETFSKNELDVMDQIAQLASIALDNARLYDELEFAVRERTAELQTSEARYRTIIENIEDGYYELNLTGDLVYFNDALVRISGYTREELRGLNYRQYTAPDTADRLYQALRHVYSSGEPVRNVEFDVWKGETRTASVGLSVSLIRDREGTATGFRGILRDMTEERRAALLQNATLRISQQALTAPTLDEFYKGVHAIVGEIVPAKNFYIAYFDPAGQTLNFPYFVDEKDQLISQADRVVRIGRGLTAYALRAGKPLRLTGAEIDELQTKGEVDPIGSKPVEWMGIPLVRGEEPFGVVVVQSYDPKVRFSDFARDLLAALARPLADTIDRKQAEEALVASEERNRLLVQSSPDPIVIYDTAGQVTDLNAAFVDTFGWTRAEVVGKTVDFVPAENKGETDVAMRDLHEHGRNVMLDTRRKTKDGRTLDVQLSASLLRGRDGLPIGNIVVLRDVTVRRRAEEAIRQQANY
ncbi:MAG TPA: PAS domain S-box protein, partial [Anaerolineae bacterium]